MRANGHEFLVICWLDDASAAHSPAEFHRHSSDFATLGRLSFLVDVINIANASHCSHLCLTFYVVLSVVFPVLSQRHLLHLTLSERTVLVQH